MKAAILYGAWLRRSFIEFRRYIFETISGVITIYGFFMILFLGARAVGSRAPGFGDTLSGLVVAYAVWVLGLFSYSNLVQGLVMEAQQGTLEQLAMSPYGLVRVLIAQTFTGVVIQAGVIGTLLVLMMASTGKWLHLDMVSILPLVVLTLLGLIGVGFALGGLAVVFKRVQSALQIIQIVLLALVATPAESVPVVKYLPLSWGTALLRRVMVDGESIFRMPAWDLLFLAMNSLFYFALGVAIFMRLEAVARERGLLGHY